MSEINTFRVDHPALDETQRIITVSDIHGNLAYIRGLVEKLQLQPQDQLVLLGDIVEKGPESLNTLRYLMSLRDRCRLYTVIGNCDFWHLWLDNMIPRPDWDAHTMQHLILQQKTVRRGIVLDMCAELGIRLDENTDLPHTKGLLREAFAPELDFLREMPFALETDRYVFVHGGIPAGMTLEEAGAWRCMKIDRFYETRPHFDKWVITGHTPVCLYHEDRIDAKPIIDSDCRLVSIDGGCVLKDDGQLNALILHNGSFSSLWYDPFPEAEALSAQEESSRSWYIRWGDNRVERLSSADGFCRIRHLRTGYEMDVPEDFLYRKNGELLVSDVSDYRPKIVPGDTISIVRETPRGYWIKKNGVTGWYSGDIRYK